MKPIESVASRLRTLTALGLWFLIVPISRGLGGDGKEPLLKGLGGYSRPVTTDSAEAQRYFDQGLNLLFAFNHDEAARAFRKATELDPECAMAWWGLALAQGPHINRPVVDPEPARVAWEAIGRAKQHADG